MHGASFLSDLAAVMLAAGLSTVLFRWLRQPAVLGYIVAGLLIGPHVLPRSLISSEANLHTLAELGVILMLFALGLEFRLGKLRKLGAAAMLIAPLETGVLFLAGYEVGQALGWKATDCVYLGAILMISSTTIITKTLGEMALNRERFAEVIFGVLIAEDIIAILLVAVLTTAGPAGDLDGVSMLRAGWRLSLFLVVTVVLGLLVVPRLLAFVGRFRSDETLLVTVLGLGFGMALLALKLGFSVGLGAFAIGVLIAESAEIHRIERLILPVKDMFSAVFFVAIGLLIDPKLLAEHAGPVALIVVVLVMGKVVACSFGAFLAGNPPSTSLRVGLGLAQIGEFSFIIAALGNSLGATSSFLYPIAVAVSAVTSALTPYLIRASGRVVGWHDRWVPPLVRDFQRDYVNWMEQVERRPSRPLGRMIRRILWMVAINLMLAVAVFITAAFLWRSRPGWFGWVPQWLGGGSTAVWFGALLLSLPLLIASIRKLEALAMILSELTVPEARQDRERLALRALVANTLWIGGSVGLGVLLLLVSSPLLPPGRMLLLAVLLALGIGFALRKSLHRLYARAQSTIEATLAREAAELPAPASPSRALPPLLEAAELRTLRLPPNAVVAGRTLRDVRLRSETGATLVALRRDGHTIISPPPEQTLAAGDELLLLGEAGPLDKAAALLEKVDTAGGG
jgi:monovalent cation:H+ antiporter-2, CPA2 family